MKPYKPSGQSAESGPLLLAAATLASAVAIGVFANFLGAHFWLLIIFPVLMGVGVGLVARRIVQIRAIRAPLLAGAVGLAGGLLTWGVNFGQDYHNIRSALTEEFRVTAMQVADPGLGPPTDEGLQHAVDVALVRWAADLPFSEAELVANIYREPVDDGTGGVIDPDEPPPFGAAFIADRTLAAHQGLTLFNPGESASEGVTLGPVGTLITWLVELLFTAWSAAWLPWSQAREPFCERCEGWYGGQEQVLALAPAAARAEVERALKHSDVPALSRQVGAIDASEPFLALYLRHCPRCPANDHHVTLARILAEEAPGRLLDLLNLEERQAVLPIPAQ